MACLKRALLAALAASVHAGTKSVPDWGDNPSKLPAMLVYTPNKLPANPAIIVGLHPCGGSGLQYQSLLNLNSYAEQLGIVLLYPTSNAQSGYNCWDCNTKKSNTHNGGGDSEGIAAMITWALKTYNGDPNKVSIVGDSSGAMMTNVMAATYPEMFRAGVSISGVPAGCWLGSPMSTPFSSDLSCPLGQKEKTYTAQMWGDLARSEYPGYNGTRPRMMIVHGTADSAVVISMLRGQLDQWSNVLGLTFTGNATNDTQPNWTKICYGDCTELVGYQVNGGGHMPTVPAKTLLGFLGLM